MTNTIERVREFHCVYKCVTKGAPDLSDRVVNELRLNLLQEELDELRVALESGDVVEALDALTDLQYILDGTYLALGLAEHKNAAFAEVHRSNMSKLGADGMPIYREGDGKVLKGPDYSPPDLAGILGLRKEEAA